MSIDASLLSALAAHCELADRRRLLTLYPQCFTAPDAVNVAMRHLRCTQSEAVTAINKLMRAGKIRHATHAHSQHASANNGAQETFEHANNAYYQFTASIAPLSLPPSTSASGYRGWLEKRGEGHGLLHAWQRRFFVVSADDLSVSYYRAPECVFPQCFIPLSDVLWCAASTSNTRRFELVTASRVYQLQAESAEVARAWVDAVTTAMRQCREQQQADKANRTKARTPRTPPQMKAFWHHGLGSQQSQSHSHYFEAARDKLGRHRAPQSSEFSPLKVSFFALNFSVSSLDQPDFFHDLRHDFRTDSDIFAYLLDALLRPESNERAATAIRQARDIEIREREANNAASAPSVLQAGSENAFNTTIGNQHNSDKLARRREEEREREEEKVPEPSHCPAPRLPRRTLRRSRSDLSLELQSLADPPSPPTLAASLSDADVDFVTPRARLRAHLGCWWRYSLFHAASHRAKSLALLDGRKRVLSWLHSDEALALLGHAGTLTQRLAIPTIFATLQSRNHDEDEQSSSSSPMAAAKAAINGIDAAKMARARRSPSLDETNASSLSFKDILATANGSEFRSRLTLPTASATAVSLAAQSTSATNSSPPRGLHQTPSRSTPLSTPSRFNTVRVPSGATPVKQSLAHSRHWTREFSFACPACRSSATELNEFLRAELDARSVSAVHVNILLSMLVTSVSDFAAISNVSSERHSVFNKRVVTDGLWLPLLGCLARAPPFVQKRALKDLTGVLVASNIGAGNCDSLMHTRQWQALVLTVMHQHQDRVERARALDNGHARGNGDRSRGASSSASLRASVSSVSLGILDVRVLEKVENYCQNVVGILHYHAFLTHAPTDFARILRRSFALSLQHGKGRLRLARAMLAVMMQRISNKLRAKSLSLTGRWPHLLELVSFVTDLTLGLPHAQTTTADAAAMHGAALDFRPLRSVHRWRASLSEDRDLIDKCLACVRAARLVADIDGSALSESKRSLIQQQIEAQTGTKSPALGASDLATHGAEANVTTSSSQSLHHPLLRSKLTSVSDDLSAEFVSWPHADRAAFLACQSHAAVLRDAAALFAILEARSEDISDDEVASVIQSFAESEKREKVFASKGIDERKRQPPKTRLRK